MNYLIHYDGCLSDISKTDSEVDGYEVFDTFAEAKRELRDYLKRRRDEFDFAVKSLAKIRKKNL